MRVSTFSMGCWIGIMMGLGGCMETPALPPVTGLSYLKRPPLRLQVETVQIHLDETLEHSLTIPNMVSMPLSLLLKQWASENFVAMGSQGTLKITLYDASIMERGISRTKPNQKEAYAGKIRVGLKLSGIPAKKQEHALALEESLTVPSQATLEERRILLQVLCERLINRLSYAVEDKIEDILQKSAY